MTTIYQDPTARIPGMKEPSAEHPMTIAPFRGRVRVSFNGRIVADTTSAAQLQEADYKPVYYIPRDDAVWGVFHPSEHKTHCPYKGEASYFTLDVEGRRSENAAWSYQNAYPAAAKIAGHIAFYPDRVDRIEVMPEQ